MGPGFNPGPILVRLRHGITRGKMSDSILFANKPAKSNPVVGILLAAVTGILTLSNVLTLIDSAGAWISGITNPGEYDSPSKLAATLALYIVSVFLGLATIILSLTSKLAVARILLIILVLLHPITVAVVWGETPIATMKYAFESLSYGINSFDAFVWFLDYILHPLIIIPTVLVVVLSFVLNKKPVEPVLATPATTSSALFNNNAVQETVSINTTNKGNNNMAAQYEVMIPGITDPQVDVATLQAWARSGRIRANTLVKEISTGATFNASQIPGVFSDKQYTTALILSILLGTIGVDRFYTGHVGIGVGKLLTAGGCGVWALVDIILYATRKVTDSEGNPLS